MAFDFPTAPKVNDTFTDPVSGAAYVWAGTKWWRTKAASRPNPKVPPPLIASLSPSSATVGDASPVTVRVRGGVYVAGSIVRVNGANVPTTFVSASELTFSYALPSVTTTVQVSVLNPDGQASGNSPFTTTTKPLVLTSIAPNTLYATNPGTVTITATGDSFTAASVIHVNGVAVATTFVSDTSLTFAHVVPTAAKTDLVKVVKGTEATAELPLKTETAPPITVSSIGPQSASKTSPPFQLTVTGQSFVADAIVYADSRSLPTVYVSPTQLTATLSYNAAGAPTSDVSTIKAISATAGNSNGQQFVWLP